MPCPVSASRFRFDIETQRSIRRMPSQWKTSGIGFRYPEAAGHSGQMPYRIDRRLGDADLAVVEQDLAVGTQGPVGKERAKLGCRNPRPGDRNRRTDVDTGADMFRKDLSGQMAPRVERDNFRRIAPLRM